jgi:diaminopropionate ammonia-lyase
MREAIGIKWVFNGNKKEKEKSNLDFLNEAKAREVRRYHESFPMYQETPLIDLKNLAKKLGLNKVYVKDESKRFGLNAFKVLGGSYASAAYLSDKFSLDINNINFDLLKSEDLKNKAGDIIFVTATDGNHGRGIAWTARQLGYKSVIFMPKGSSASRVNNIKAEGAEVIVLDCNYDDAVRHAKQYAIDNNGVLMQDTALEGYEEIPLWIMQGYLSIGHEIITHISESHDKITHLFLQAGVGSFTAAILGYFINIYGRDNFKSIIIEPENASCIYKSALINDGKPHAVEGDLKTIMAGLACGEPNPIAWPILRDYADCFVSCPDYVASRGMRILANPLGDDEKIVSGESGAPGLGLISLIMEKDELKDLRQALELDENSKAMIISTEGDTDPDNYRRILWDGI